MEGEPQDVPLHRVGVLELVDEHDPVAAAQPRPAAGPVPGSASVVCSRVSRSSKPTRCGAPLAPVDLGAHGAARTGAARSAGLSSAASASGTSVAWPSCTTACAELARASASASSAAVARCPSPLAQVEVLHDLADEVVEVLDEYGAGVDIAGRAQPDEHLLAELVRGRDGGRVERSSAPRPAASPARDIGVAAAREVAQQRVVAAARRGEVGAGRRAR